MEHYYLREPAMQGSERYGTGDRSKVTVERQSHRRSVLEIDEDNAYRYRPLHQHYSRPIESHL